MTRHFVGTAMLLAVLPACSLVTDFSAPDKELYSLNENMNTDITVVVTGDTAALTMTFVEPLPGSVDNDEDMLALVTDGTIDLVVIHDTNGVNFNLAADGNYTHTLAGPGDYYLTMGEDRLTLTVNFFNQVENVHLWPDGDYSAAISVIDNTWFVVESFTRDVAVQ